GVERPHYALGFNSSNRLKVNREDMVRVSREIARSLPGWGMLQAFKYTGPMDGFDNDFIAEKSYVWKLKEKLRVSKQKEHAPVQEVDVGELFKYPLYSTSPVKDLEFKEISKRELYNNFKNLIGKGVLIEVTMYRTGKWKKILKTAYGETEIVVHPVWGEGRSVKGMPASWPFLMTERLFDQIPKEVGPFPRLRVILKCVVNERVEDYGVKTRFAKTVQRYCH
ncbi:hypothetical protein ACFL6Y_11865, partial [Elusimicrobiota bacterium]